jgi:hypothetical protein
MRSKCDQKKVRDPQNEKTTSLLQTTVNKQTHKQQLAKELTFLHFIFHCILISSIINIRGFLLLLIVMLK